MTDMTNQSTDAINPQFGVMPNQSAGAQDMRLHVDLGNYTLISENGNCGELWVEFDPNYPGDTSRTIEHWMLFANYVTPSMSHRDVSLRLIYQEGVYRDLEHFVSENRQNPTTKYIKATPNLQFGAMPNQSADKRDDRTRQVDLGNYKLISANGNCGELWVEFDPNYPGDTSRTIEHWMLFANYVTPSMSHRDVSIRLVYQKGVHRDLAHFVRENRQNSTTSYIKAPCVRARSLAPRPL